MARHTARLVPDRGDGKGWEGEIQDKGRVDGKGSAYIEMAALDRNVAVSPLVSSDCAQGLWRAIIVVGPSFLLLYPSASVPGQPPDECSQPQHGDAPFSPLGQLGMAQGSVATFPGSQRKLYPVKRM